MSDGDEVTQHIQEQDVKLFNRWSTADVGVKDVSLIVSFLIL